MKSRNSRRGLALVAVLALLAVRSAEATVVEFQTVMGNFEVNLYDNITPATVANFLDYVHNGGYTNSVIHRSVPDFVIQGGGYQFDGSLPLEAIATNPTVDNEPALANVRGTIGMAKRAGRRNSATSQWFFNLEDNSASLDYPDGGYTVFGEVVGNGMNVVDAIAALPVFDLGSPADNIPLRNYTSADFDNSVEIDGTHVVIISAVVISDSSVDSAAALDPLANTSTLSRPPPVFLDTGSGAGATGIFFLPGLIVAICMRRRRKSNPAEAWRLG